MKHLQALVIFDIRADNLDAIVREEEFLQPREVLDALQLADLIELQVEDAEMD